MSFLEKSILFPSECPFFENSIKKPWVPGPPGSRHPDHLADRFPREEQPFSLRVSFLGKTSFFLSECKLCLCVPKCVVLNFSGTSDSIFSCVQLEDLLRLNAVECFGVMTLDYMPKDSPKAAASVGLTHDLILVR